ncbi:mannan endo-1,4-beta-mannosidase 2-like [Dioscorea cayenensis subsp. rotundata]|uniref:mannan endo-1,4-beta-mannosidase n=1 Tax=Dioscorea cayennensis subsp. rotundata TaxID=55577 RepID=A0AB40B4Z2_DIOCR|nr:mannan endo-1,4-beta-mannosidase 2-like [Dioscorea cayenensis subsp. rotundata]
MLGNRVLFPFLGLASCVIFIYITYGDFGYQPVEQNMMSFVGRNETKFMLDGKPFFVNGWNSYWLMDHAVEKSTRQKVRDIFYLASKMGLTVCRTWAFNDGTYNALQVSLGNFDEQVFQGLDYVIMEARKHGIRLLLSLVNNLEAYGGKPQYVQWAWEEGLSLNSSEDSFFFDPAIRSYFKDYLKAILTRENHLTGIEYRDDPTIFAWELMNEPRCVTDPSGDTLQKWIEEMSAYVKSIDKNHLVTIGIEGFYGPKSPPEKRNVNPSEYYGNVGTDFISNTNASGIDFASVHVYPDQWLEVSELDNQLRYIFKWVNSHIEDGEKILKKPVLLTEFGLSCNSKDFHNTQRDKLYKTIFDIVYKSAQENGAGAGALVWQLMVKGMDTYVDDYGFIPRKRSSLFKLLKEQSCRMAVLHHGEDWARKTSKGECRNN